jgi:hypothetical protein
MMGVETERRQLVKIVRVAMVVIAGLARAIHKNRAVDVLEQPRMQLMLLPST